jgi:hypothetical protein
MSHPDTNASHKDNLKRTGGHGRKKSIGINTSTNMKKEKRMIPIRADTDKVKENTAVRYKEPVEKVIFCRLIKNARMQGAQNPEE